MKQRFSERLDALEQRKAHRKYSDNLGAFYAMARKDRESSVAPFYGEVATNGKS